MFGISSFSEAPFSSLVVTEAGGWQEIRNNVNRWIDEDFNNYRQPRILLENGAALLLEDLGYMLLSDEFVVRINVWQDANGSANNWVEV
jgi:hypothetical protein